MSDLKTRQRHASIFLAWVSGFCTAGAIFAARDSAPYGVMVISAVLTLIFSVAYAKWASEE